MRNHWLRKHWKLKIDMEPNVASYFLDLYVHREIILTYGPYTTRFDADGVCDLRMSNNSDPVAELAGLVVADLEHHPLSKNQIINSIYGTKRIALRLKDKARILKVCRGLSRGEDISEHLF